MREDQLESVHLYGVPSDRVRSETTRGQEAYANLFLTRILMLVWLSLRYRLNTECLPQVIERVPDFPIVIWTLICYTFGENGSSGSRPGDPVSARGRPLAWRQCCS